MIKSNLDAFASRANADDDPNENVFQTYVDGKLIDEKVNVGFQGFTKYTYYDNPNTTYQYTIANGINDWGNIVGFFQGTTGYHAFLKQGNNFTNFDVPDAVLTHASGINNQGDIVGFFYDGTQRRGFLKQGNNYSAINVPGAYSTYVYGINNQGDIVGFFYDGTQRRGFIARKKPSN